MSGIRKSTDFGLSNAERKTLRASEAEEAMSDHNEAQKAFNENKERLRQARLDRETAAGPMLYAAPGLPDDTLVEKIHLSTRIRNALTAGGFKTAGEIREASDATLLSLQDLGPGSLRHLREKLGLKARPK
jgi:DNA-directed RNA polymerase alpha subunit